MYPLSRENIFDIFVTSAPEKDILQYIITSLQKKDDPYYIVTPNPEIIVHSLHYKTFADTLNHARIALPDGQGLVWASSMMKKTIKRRIAGIDFMEKLCETLSKQHGIIGLLGGRANVAEKTAECLMKKYPGLRVGFVGEELDINQFRIQSVRQAQDKNSKFRIDVLFVAYGFPKQEEWMREHIGKIPATVMMGVGGAFDFISGKTLRAPESIRKMGLEWLFRLIVQPWRIKRQLALVEFGWRVMSSAFGFGK